MSVKVAVIQYRAVPRDVTENIKRLTNLITEAASNGANLIVAPELAFSGYTMMSSEEAEKLAECPTWLDDTDSPSTYKAMGAMYELARALHVCLVFGYIEKDPGTKKLYNSQLLLEGDGFREGYRKVNRFGQDWIWASPGVGNPPIVRSKLLGKRIGLLICRDVRDKRDDKWSDFYSPGEADIVAFSANFGRGAFPATSWVEFAIENKVHLCVSNNYGVEDNLDFGAGGVCVIHPDGSVDCEGLRWNEDCIVYSDII